MATHWRHCTEEGCSGSVGIEDADFDWQTALKTDGLIETLECNTCGKEHHVLVDEDYYVVMNSERTKTAEYGGC